VRSPPVALSQRERDELTRWTRGRSVPVRKAERARIVLLAAEGRNNREISQLLHLSPVTVRRWRSRFALLGMEGISGDAPRSGHREESGSTTVSTILERTRTARPPNGVRWTTRTLAKELGVSHTTIGKVWRGWGVRPPRYRRWRLATDPRYLAKRVDVAGIYVNPPGTVLALTIEPLNGSPGPAADTAGAWAPDDSVTPAENGRRPGGAEELAETVRSLDGLPISASPWRLSSQELLMFLQSMNERIPRSSEVHLLTGASALSRDSRILRWIGRHPRFHLDPREVDQPISNVVREWFQPRSTQRPPGTGLPHLPVLEQVLGIFLDEVALFGRPFAWTRSGAVSHWRDPGKDTFPISSQESSR
jgi:transposase